MHVHELNPKKTLITLVGFALLLLVGFLTMHKPFLSYSLDMNQSMEMLNDSNAYFYPSQLTAVLDKTAKDVVLIDLRNNFVYGRSHIPGAENISAYDLALEENIKRLENYNKQGVTVVFYGDGQLQANGPWMLFRQLGFTNIKVLLGGYNYYMEMNSGISDSLNSDTYLKEVPKYDYAQVVNAGKSDTASQSETKSVVKVVRRKKAAHTASGGC